MGRSWFIGFLRDHDDGNGKDEKGGVDEVREEIGNER